MCQVNRKFVITIQIYKIESIFEYCSIKPNLDCNYTFPIDLAAKCRVFGKMQRQFKLQKSVSLCAADNVFSASTHRKRSSYYSEMKRNLILFAIFLFNCTQMVLHLAPKQSKNCPHTQIPINFSETKKIHNKP